MYFPKRIKLDAGCSFVDAARAAATARDAARFAVGATTRDITGAAVGAAVGAAAEAVVVSVFGDAAGAAVWVTFGYAAGIAVGAATRHAAGPPRTKGARWFVRMCSEVNPGLSSSSP